MARGYLHANPTQRKEICQDFAAPSRCLNQKALEGKCGLLKLTYFCSFGRNAQNYKYQTQYLMNQNYTLKQFLPTWVLITIELIWWTC